MGPRTCGQCKYQVPVPRTMRGPQWRVRSRHGPRSPCVGTVLCPASYRWQRLRWWCWPARTGRSFCGGADPDPSRTRGLALCLQIRRSISKGAAQKCVSEGVVALPTGLAATNAPTVAPQGNTKDAVPSPPLNIPVNAPVPAPTVPMSNVSCAASKARRPRAR